MHWSIGWSRRHLCTRLWIGMPFGPSCQTIWFARPFKGTWARDTPGTTAREAQSSVIQTGMTTSSCKGRSRSRSVLSGFHRRRPQRWGGSISQSTSWSWNLSSWLNSYSCTTWRRCTSQYLLSPRCPPWPAESSPQPHSKTEHFPDDGRLGYQDQGPDVVESEAPEEYSTIGRLHSPSLIVASCFLCFLISSD